MLRQIVIPSASNRTVMIPEVYYGTKVMVTFSALNEKKMENSKECFTKTEEARNFFNSIQVDMTGFKFNREEANER